MNEIPAGVQIGIPNQAEFEQRLTEFNHVFPLDEVKLASENQDAVIPLLLGYLQKAIEAPDSIDELFIGHLIALFLLSQFKESKAFPLVIKLCKLPYEQQEALLGDIITEDLCKFIAGTFNGNLDAIKELMEDSTIQYFVRHQVFDSLYVLFNEGRLHEEDIHDYSITLYERFLDSKDKDGMTILVNFWSDIDCGKYLKLTELAFENNLVDEQVASLDFYKRVAKKGLTHQYKDNPWCQPITNTIDEMSDWSCFNEDDGGELNKLDLSGFDEPYHHHNHGDGCGCGSSSTVVYAEPKIGRNAPCYCGSGKKFKKCCLQ